MKHINTILFITLILWGNNLNAQVAINTDNSNPDASAMLDIKSTNKGVLVPRLTSTQRNSITSPTTGLMVYNSTDNRFEFYNGTAWNAIGNDNLGDHSATQNIVLGNHWISRDILNTVGIQLESTGVQVKSNSARPTTFKSITSNRNDASYIEINNNVGTRALFGVDGNGLSGGDTSDVVLANWSNGGLTFFTNAAERMRITNTGILGIGRTVPDVTTKLDVNGAVKIQSTGNAIKVLAANGTNNVFIREEYANSGAISLYNSTGNERMAHFVDASTDAAAFFTYGPNSQNVLVGNLTGFSDHGFIGVGNSAGSPTAGIYIDASGNGIVYGTTKSFRIDHPKDENKEIWYACIEGPEAAAYVRGTAKLVNGKATIPFPEHFSLIISEPSLTVTLTPNSANSKGLAVVERTANGFEVRELSNGTGSYSFDWVAMAVRENQKDFKVVREKKTLLGTKRNNH